MWFFPPHSFYRQTAHAGYPTNTKKRPYGGPMTIIYRTTNALRRAVRRLPLHALADIIIAALACLFLGTAVQAADPAPRSFDIPAQSLEGALIAFGTQSGIEVLFNSDTSKDLRSPGVSGTHIPDHALRLLLAGTGLTAKVTSTGAVTIERPIIDPLAALVAEARKPIHYAQVTEPTPDKPQAPAKKPEEGPTTLPEITVTASPLDETSYNVQDATTATKTDTPIMETPISIQVVPRAVIEDQQAIQLGDAVKNVSGVFQGFTFGGFGEEFMIRGFNTNFANYLDGFRFPASRIPTANAERIEVVKGAAANLYGRIEPGGLINVVTKRPLATPYYSLQQQFGSFDLYRTTADATGPITSDGSLLYRFNLEYVDRNSFRDFAFTDRIFVAPSLTWNLNDRTQLDLDFRYSDEDTQEDQGVVAIGNRPANIPISRYLGEPSTDKSNTKLYTTGLTLNHDFTDDWKVRARFVNHNRDVVDRITGGAALDETTGVLDRSFFGGEDEADDYFGTLDVTGKFSTWGAEHKVLVGWDYYNNSDEVRAFLLPAGSINIFNPVYGRSGVDLSREQENFFIDQLREWTGVYFQDQITLWDKVHILGGGRYDWASFGVGLAFGTDQSLADARANFQEADDERFSPRVGLVYQPWDWLSLYGNYVESLGSPFGSAFSDGTPLPSETAEQYEVGFKTEFLEERLTSTVAFYHLTKQNIPVPIPGTPFSEVIGEARSRGIEVDIAGEVTEGLSLIATYAYTDAEITKDVNNQGNRLFNVPRHSGSLWAKYDMQQAPLRGLSLGAGVYLLGQREGDNGNTFQLPGYGRVDALVKYQLPLASSKLSLQFNVENLLDHRYYVAAGGRTSVNPGASRTFIGSIRLEF